MRQIWFATGLALATAVLTMGAEANETIHSEYPLTAGGKIQIENADGGVTITGWDRDVVEIDGEKHARTEADLSHVNVEVQASPGLVSIRTLAPREGGVHGGATLRLHVPRRATLDRVESSNGFLSVSGIEGEARLITSNGAIRVEQFSGRLEATTSNGPIQIRGLRPDPASLLVLRTSNGPIELAFDGGPVPSVRATTSNGPITAWLPDGASARIKASTSNAPISSDFALATPAGWRQGSTLEATLGQGGNQLDLHTSNGPIRLRRGAPKESVSSRFTPHGPR